MSFTEQSRVFDLMQYTVKQADIKLVKHNGKIADAQGFYKRWATEMLAPGWYALVYDEGEIINVVLLTDHDDDFVAYSAAVNYIASELLDRLEMGQGLFDDWQ